MVWGMQVEDVDTVCAQFLKAGVEVFVKIVGLVNAKNKSRERKISLLTVSTILSLVTLVSLLLRIGYRFKKRILGWDDIFASVATVSSPW